MLNQPIDTNHTLGADIRALRKARGMTLAGLSDALGKSVGWLSQVERDISEPSINDLRSLAAVLDVSISSLFATRSEPGEEGKIVRKDARRPIGSRDAGLIEELLSPDLTDDFEVVHSTFLKGACLAEDVTRPTQEVGYIVQGQLDVWISGAKFTVTAGDSFRIRHEPHRWENPYDDPCVVIWVIAPPVY